MTQATSLAPPQPLAALRDRLAAQPGLPFLDLLASGAVDAACRLCLYPPGSPSASSCPRSSPTIRPATTPSPLPEVPPRPRTARRRTPDGQLLRGPPTVARAAALGPRPTHR